MTKQRKHILIIRFSALGDVVILAPLLKLKMTENPGVEATVAAPHMLAPFFSGIPNLTFMGIDRHAGNLKIFRQLKTCHPTVVADLHSVTRTFLLDLLFLLHLVPVHVLLKQRFKRRRLLKHKDIQLATSWQHYDYTLRQCGLEGITVMPPYIVHHPSSDGIIRVGIAPFSTSQGKNYPVDKMETVISLLSARQSWEVWLFGGKKYWTKFQEWASRYPGVRISDSTSFESELELIKKLDVMVSMDSANIHFASALDVPAVTVWGATHPYCGFAGWRQNPEWSVQVDLPCRPCSIYGSKPCSKGTYECMQLISPEKIVEKVLSVVEE